MKHVVGFTEASNQPPFFSYESDAATPSFTVGSKIRVEQQGGQWLQVLSIGYQLLADTMVTTVVVARGTSVGGESEDFAPYPW